MSSNKSKNKCSTSSNSTFHHDESNHFFRTFGFRQKYAHRIPHARGLNLHFSVSATSRAPRGTERNGVEYFFLSPEEFRTRIAAGEFLEYEEVYTDRFYGTLLAPVEHQLATGQNVISDIDVKGALNFKRHYGDRCLTVFIQPPSISALRDRLERRGTETAEAIQMRLDKAEYEMSFAPQFDTNFKF